MAACQKDISKFEEQGGHFKEEQVILFWDAIATNNLEVVRRMIDYGADLNMSSPRGCTPVLSACEHSSIAVAEYLIRLGANIQTPNKSGETCLMKAVTCKELCQLLMINGADVKTQDISGCLALHYAIMRNQPDTVQLLLDHGSDPYVKNEAGDDAFRTASLKGKELILEELLFKLKPPVQRWIESYQLLGGYYVDDEDEIELAIIVWKDAIDIQQKNSGVEIIPSKPNPVYLFAQEVNTVEELEALSWNRESVNMYALMIRERILGPNHYHTIRGLLDRGKSYKCNGEIRRCIDIWKYALQLQNFEGGQMTALYFEITLDLCFLFYDSCRQSRQSDGGVDQRILIRDLFEILEIVTMKMESTVGKKPAENNNSKEVYAYFMSMMLLTSTFILELNTNAHQVRSFRNLVRRLVRCQPRTKRGRTLLHISVLLSTFLREIGGSHLVTQSIDLVELLLECGANVNAVDDEQNTALHFCSRSIWNLKITQHDDLIKRMAELLLKHGAHVDIVNSSGIRAADGMTYSLIGWKNWNVLDLVNLKCLAARVVMKYGISYVGHIPASLESFVPMHGKPLGCSLFNPFSTSVSS